MNDILITWLFAYSSYTLPFVLFIGISYVRLMNGFAGADRILEAHEIYIMFILLIMTFFSVILATIVTIQVIHRLEINIMVYAILAIIITGAGFSANHTKVLDKLKGITPMFKDENTTK